jgi:hypothetical protein
MSEDSGTDNSAISFGGLVVLLDDRLDPWCFSRTITVSRCRMTLKQRL